ncbi:DsbE family thiol:disulfide interchange protein [Profundibacterium mesophilum]|uniref:Thiol-disulfide interchange protein n=1 Tax=Profundibacterium mesophilum KAUST100406-0324 TaxID=1037889 RepID=A0A921NP10_9RHOB|nr:DsbE family thiol:disulfide interchange protein [Profundibacterium mesophilum]KAF0674812.1 putative thiol-disulfide interchange protein [Profundibacterium mesophilum KAUST100406-0324]
MARIPLLMIAPPALFLGLAALFYAGMQREDPDALPSSLTGQAAPQMELTPLGDYPEFTRDLLDEPGVKMVNIWASWCAPCRVEHPNLIALAEEGIPIYGVNYKDKPDNAIGFLQELGNPFAAVSADASGRMALEWGAYGVPETYVIDGEGQIVLRFAGPITQRVIEAQIRPALAQAAGS